MSECYICLQVTYRALEGIGFASNKLLEAEDSRGCGDYRIDGDMGLCCMPAFPGDGRREPSRSGEKWPWPGADGTHRQMCVNVHAENGLHVIQDAFLQHMIPAGVALLGRLEDKLHCALSMRNKRTWIDPSKMYHSIT